MVRVLAYGQYSHSDLQEIWISQEVLAELRELDVEFFITSGEKGPQFICSGQPYDVFIVDKWSHKCDEDIVALSKRLHPTVPVVMTRPASDRVLFKEGEREGYDLIDLIDFQDGRHDADPVGCVVRILTHLGLI